MGQMRYRLGLDLGTTSLGWAMVRLDKSGAPCAVIRAGVRIFPDGRNPKDGSSLAVTRREARAMRRRRDRLLRRKARLAAALVRHGMFPESMDERRKLEPLDPYALRKKGLDQPLTPHEMGRAIFHLNQRRGFLSNRKTDRKDSESGALKGAISQLRTALAETGCRTVGEWLAQRHSAGQSVRARLREIPVVRPDGKSKLDKRYDLYVDRAMVQSEFDALWSAQAQFNPLAFNELAKTEIRQELLFQRPLRPVTPGRCTLLPDQPRAPLALPSTQRARMYQEVNHLRILGPGMSEEPLTIEQRDQVIDALEKHSKRTFRQIQRLLGLGSEYSFNLEDAKRTDLKGNLTSAILSDSNAFGDVWHEMTPAQQDEIVSKLIEVENEDHLISWLCSVTGVDEATAERIAGLSLPEGYGSLSHIALERILKPLQDSVITFDKAVIAAGFDHHSRLGAGSDGVIHDRLPYYGEALQRHVSFGTGNLADTDEKRFGRIANPTVHIGLNQVRTVVNALIHRYGHPSEVIVELARDLKQSREQRQEDTRRQAENQRRNKRLREVAAGVLAVSPERVRPADIQKLILWEELSSDPADRRCPYSGEQISLALLMSEQVEVEHILPFSMTLDDSLNNKTVALRKANRIKGNRTPFEAYGQTPVDGFDYAGILARAEAMPKGKRFRFLPDGYTKWLKDGDGFLARALNDTRYLSRIAKEYLNLICPQATRAIPGQMTAMLRGKFGLNDILGTSGQKNRDNHRHHAVDACVVAVTDQGLLQRFAQASADARSRQLDRLVEEMPLPWDTYRDHVTRAVSVLQVSHKPDHGHEGAMHNETAMGLIDDERVSLRRRVDGRRIKEVQSLKVIRFGNERAAHRHGQLPNGEPRPYKGYKGDSNYCMEITRGTGKKWEWRVVSTYEAYQAVRRSGSTAVLTNSHTSLEGKPLVMRLIIGDCVRLDFRRRMQILTVKKISSAGQIFVAGLDESNVRARSDAGDPDLVYGSISAATLQRCNGRRVFVSPIGDVRDPGFRP